ncbi:MAG: amidohydrolase [Bacillota bacterium]
MAADLVILEARVATMNPDRPHATAVAVKGERIVDVGTDLALRRWIGPRTQVVAAGGRRLMPGFIDSHMHLLGYGLLLERVDLSGARSLSELVRLVHERAAQLPPGAWVLGGGWDEEQLGGLPTRDWLDRAAPDHPVLLARHCYHVAAANTEALCRSGLWERSSEIPGGRMDRDQGGRPTGILRENAKEHADRAVPPPTTDDLRRALKAAAAAAARFGITSIHSNDGQGFPLQVVYQVYRDLQAGPSPLPLRVWWDFAEEDLEQAAALGWRTGLGDTWFRVGSVKFFADGSLGGRTAALRTSYADDPGNRGLLLWDRDSLARRMGLALRLGFQVAVHAIGDAAAEQTLQAYDQAMASQSPWTEATGSRPGVALLDPDHSVSRLRLIHCQVMDPGLWAEMARLGAVAEVQPRFLASDYPMIEPRLGPARAAAAYAWRSLARMGIPMAFGSDCPVEPLNPMHAVYAAVTRHTMDGQPPGGWRPEERLSVAEALAMHTRGGAFAVGEEQCKGQVAPGFLADMVLLDRDPLTAEPSSLKDIAVDMTIAGGRVAFSR